MARNQFDYVVVDMPSTLVQWSETVLTSAHVYFAMLELDMRSAQNALRFKRALQSEELPFEKLRYVMNRAPKFTDLSGKSRVKRMAESLSISIDVQLPDGGKPVTQANDHGLPLANPPPKARCAAKSPNWQPPSTISRAIRPKQPEPSERAKRMFSKYKKARDQRHRRRQKPRRLLNGTSGPRRARLTQMSMRRALQARSRSAR